MTPKKEQNHGGHLALMVIALPVGLFVADLVGRIRAFFQHEWPFISWGLLILFIVVVISISFYIILDELHCYGADVEAKLKEVKNEIGGIQTTIDQVRGDTTRTHENLNKELRTIERNCKNTIEKVDELIQQKGPILPQTPGTCQESATSVQEAVSEIVKGAS